MATKRGSEGTLDGLLGRLAERGDTEASRASFTGRAVSRSKEHLHLAVETGVIAIPLAQIDRVDQLHPGDDTIVRVEVKRADSVTHLVEDDSLSDSDVVARSRAAAVAAARKGIIITIDTATITGGVPDACDDGIIVANW